METITLGRTGLQATIAGLGCGGHSRLGIAQGKEHAASIVRAAYDGGVNFFDTSAAYGTEEALGDGLAGISRGTYILSSKFPYKHWDGDGKLKTPEELMAQLDHSLRALRTEYLDVYHLHAVTPEDYEAARDTLVPTLQKAKEQGKIRFLGVTELFGRDTAHAMLRRALPDDLFDVVMVGYNLLNPSAAKTVLPLTMRYNVGTLCMFAVRAALSNPSQLEVDIGRIIASGQADASALNGGHSLDFLTQSGVAASIMEAAYRFCRHTPGIDVTLTGTGNAAHLQDNLRSIAMGPLPEETLDRLAALFGNVDCVSGE